MGRGRYNKDVVEGERLGEGGYAQVREERERERREGERRGEEEQGREWERAEVRGESGTLTRRAGTPR